MNILDDLKWRGLWADCTDEAELSKRLASGPIVLYCGFDPTADSLHAGNLVPLIALRRFQIFGHHPIALAGGATGSIGDPSGRTQERQLLNADVLARNIACVKQQLRRLLDFDSPVNPARLLDNNDWTAPVSYLDFLREVGKHFSINMMVSKESVRARMEDRECGISYTEFSYMLLQAFDFYHLCKERTCELQIGGSDQWGNITAGTDLIRKKLARSAFGLTLPLITNADGSKFGKTVAGAVWLDPKRTSAYRFYQFWIRTDDRDVIRYLKYFTFLSHEEINDLDRQHLEKPEARMAHRALAKAVTDMIHGPTATQEAQRASEILFGGDLEGVSESTFNEIVGEVPTQTIQASRLAGPGLPLVEALVHAGLCPSKGQARKDLDGGGIYINNVREAGATRALTAGDLLFGKHLLLRKGKRNYVVLSVINR
ncbi:MAG TPA: tyrosine--tRNA ligase [Verrucomicrobiota bacterium]|nr:tyrosine--tRNA ligase [Verrucomicrobiota bacterium]HRZ35062.1 tyrosine--tRNA ligase [Candidatus Paceibacterota bacterium]HRZ54984.1 tyrosine--tRNA ligase [Candidatus Paceibacterota bacterium]